LKFVLGFTTTRPEGFEDAAGSQGHRKVFPPSVILSDMPSEVDLFVASTSKVCVYFSVKKIEIQLNSFAQDFGKKVYRKVAVVEEFFEIIYNVHMELGGRSGMHAGQKRTYRIVSLKTNTFKMYSDLSLVSDNGNLCLFTKRSCDSVSIDLSGV